MERRRPPGGLPFHGAAEEPGIDGQYNESVHRGPRTPGEFVPAGAHPGMSRYGNPEAGTSQYRGPQYGESMPGPQHGRPHSSMAPHRENLAHVPQYGSHHSDGSHHMHSYPNLPQHGGPHPNLPQHGGPLPNLPQHGGPLPNLPQHGGPLPNLPQHGGPLPNLPQHGGPHPNLPQHGGPHPNLPQHGGPHPNLPQHGGPHPNLPQHGGPHPNLPQHGGPHPNLPQHGGPHPNLPQHGGPHPNLPQNGGALPILPQHGGPHPNLPQHGGPHPNMPQHAGPYPNLPQHGGPHSFMPQHADSQSNTLQYMDPQTKMSHYPSLHSNIPQHAGLQSNMSSHRGPLSNMPQNKSSQSQISQHGDVNFQDPTPNFVCPETDVFQNRGPESGMPHHSGPSPCISVPQILKSDTPRYSHNSGPLHVIQHSSPYLPSPNEDLYHSNRNLTNPPFAATQMNVMPIEGDKEYNIKVRDAQPHAQNLDHFLKEERLLNLHVQGENPQGMESAHIMSTFKPSEEMFIHVHEHFVPEDQVHVQGDMFMQNDRPNMQRDGSFLYQHGHSLQHGDNFMPQGNCNIQSESLNMNLKRQHDDMWTFGNHVPSEKDMFKNWLSSFLAHRRNKQPSRSESTRSPSITEARELIYGTLRLLSQLKSLCQTLETGAESKESWAKDFPKAATIRDELQRKMKKLEEPGFIHNVKRKLGGVRKKRLRQQRAKKETEEDKRAVEYAAEKEARIDRWRMQCVQQVEEKKRERELKAAADRVLSEVRKKQADTKKMLDVLKSLEKLRKLRKEAAGRKGVFPPQSSDETFENHIQRLRTMVHKRVALYDAEERALNVILEGEQEEERKKDKEKRTKKEREKFLHMQQEVDSILFGDPDPLPPHHFLQPFRQYYLQAENSVVSLVHIRHDWDRFLVTSDHPDSSSIPRGWVTPKSPSSDTWATAVLKAE
ncbi:programmed cell death protein 7 isoform X2 [Pelobates fuscus]|uniref:programmed cell death protein 7 isoform X2 n=1 Tax=Pelobates fuscus TaxID=191477 RepID=UPI002FE4F43F